MVARWTPHRVQVQPRRQLQPLCDGCRRPQRDAPHQPRRQRSRSRLAARRSEPGVQLRIAIAASDATISIASGSRDGAVERLTTFFEGYAFMPNVSPDGDWVAFVATTFPMDGGWTLPGARPRTGDAADVAVRRHRPLDAGRTGRPMGNRSRTCRCCSEPSTHPGDLVVRRFAASRSPGEPARWHYYPDWSPDGRCSRLASARSTTKAKTGTWRSSIPLAPCRCSA